MMKLNFATLAVLLVAIGQAPRAAAQTIEDTDTFLVNKLDNTTLGGLVQHTFANGQSAGVSRTTITQSLRFLTATNGVKGCVFRAVVDELHEPLSKGNSGGHWHHEGAVDAGTFDISSARVFNATDDSSDFALYGISVPLINPTRIYGTAAEQEKKFVMFTGTEEMANRVLRAFIGLGKLCGAKSDPY